LLVKNKIPECIWKTKSILGEGTLWVSKLSSIFFVDIKKKKIFILNTKTNKKKIIKVNKEIGFISHIKNNFFLLGLKSELRIVDLKKNKKIFSINIELKKKNNRINDGKTDPIGRVWFGTMDNLEKKRSGSLYCLDTDLKLHKIDDSYFITNGPAFLDKNNFYHTDSAKRIIYRIKINNRYKILKKSIFIKFNRKDGFPDGMTTDTKNNLWVCHYNGGKITVYDKRGNKIHKILLAAKNITNCAFGGYESKELFVSTALKGMRKDEIKKYPFSGNFLKIKTNLRGKRTIPFKIKNFLY
tara:strand:+ start:474 stop:1367 length:894 start_codon:yes stop_codon:yes gene_type:complete